jgi:hypothetical protein
MPVYDQDSPSAFIFNVQMSVQNANNLTMVVNDTGTATVADLNRKVDLNGGDLSDTVVDTFTAATAEYPVPAAGDTMKVIGGKIVKFCADIVKTFTGASASAAGKKGLVPAPAAGRNTYYLRGDGTWQAPVNDNTATVAGRVMDARQANPNISGTIAANVKSLNDSFVSANNWRYLTSLNETNGYVVNLPEDWREAYISTFLGDSLSFGVPLLAIRRDTITDGYHYLRSGFANGAETGQVVIEVTSTTIRLSFAQKNGSDVKSTSTARVYYKPGYYYFG